ncbi:dormancy-associated protein 2-like [Hevea brasiliensis]|uniref:dormancy-associated protein 2-like n=1 Tax=Hevea brasiliensis TaxID=3981 RepID=UPI0025ED7F71|nr:dormancy-associated protein 2-like [Hevea brasiliensis]
MACSKTFLLLVGLAFAALLLISSEVSAREFAEAVQTKESTNVDINGFPAGKGHGHGHGCGHGHGHGHGSGHGHWKGHGHGHRGKHGHGGGKTKEYWKLKLEIRRKITLSLWLITVTMCHLYKKYANKAMQTFACPPLHVPLSVRAALFFFFFYNFVLILI